MAIARRARAKAPFDPRLVCGVERLEYDFSARTGKLWLPGSQCCDMSGCIGLFTAIDHRVRRIETFNADGPDTFYLKVEGTWFARRDR
jgi:hypothetical protein